jgi:protein-disulfide isomerase
MASNKKKQQQRQGLSWELIGIVGILALLVIGGIFVLTTGPKESGQLETPSVVAQDPSIGLAAPEFTGVDEDQRPFLGKADAPVTFYEFADFQCPHCRDFSMFQSKDIKRDLIASGKARLVWVAFPFMDDGDGERESENAQMAAHCASQQDKFWTFHDWLFTNQATVANQGTFNKARLHDMAVKAGLDVAAYDTCMDDPATAAFVKKDKDFGVEKGVGSTPSFIIKDKDKLYAGAGSQELTDLRSAIEEQAASGG